ncbi:hypothetical protein RRG08_029935 [Elysia crispata]|uniref:Lipase domain-containing protein n=1 Tax=Elysia crispata TaxID=231223 RepID=A0AAE1DHS6_9GAST|nr:hypothetical protein RRG08_029935 [Elysia crispata]
METNDVCGAMAKPSMKTLLLAFLLTAFSFLPKSAGAHRIQKRSTVCYDHLGCFSNTGAFYSVQRPLTLTPSAPSSIRTTFRMYTREDKTSGPQLDARYLDNAHLTNQWMFFKARPTKIIIHGFLDSPSLVTWLSNMKDELLILGDFNVIIVDWSMGNKPPYTQATANTRVVGAQIALLVDLLMKGKGLGSSDFHLIGHSLGAHTAGYAGERIPGLGRITGLDPAGPYFEGTDKVVRLDPSDAVLVDVIHSDAEPLIQLGFGLKQQVGHMDFYPNLGHDQPGCDPDPIRQLSEYGLLEGVSEVAACSHLRSIKFFTESINTACPFQAFPCASEGDFNSNKCRSCQGSGCASMGMHADKNRPISNQNVKYFLNTADHAPFCEYHLEITIKLSQGDSTSGERGNLALVVKGDKSISSRLTLNSSPVMLSPGSIYRFSVGVASDVGRVQAADLSWHHVNSITDPLHWNILGSRHPKISVDEVDIFRIEDQTDVHLCARSKQVETDHTLQITNTC